MRHYHAHLTLRSSNRKVGPIPVSLTGSDCCPTSCTFRGAGCYAEHGPMSIHWRAVSDRERGMPWEMFCDAVETLEDQQLWRHNTAGDLPGDGETIDREALDQLLAANRGKRGFTYTHYRPDNDTNAAAVRSANQAGFTVNLSANNLTEADRLADLGVGPVVVVLPHTVTANTKTPAGRTVVVCPATQRDDVSCATCQLCQRQRTTVVGFPAHGSRFKGVSVIAAQTT